MLTALENAPDFRFVHEALFFHSKNFFENNNLKLCTVSTGTVSVTAGVTSRNRHLIHLVILSLYRKRLDSLFHC